MFVIQYAPFSELYQNVVCGKLVDCEHAAVISSSNGK